MALKSVSAQVMMLVWDGVAVAVLVFSLLGVLTEVQRSESIDLARLLHLPIGLRQVFVFNYLISLVSLSTVAGLAVMLGLSVGLCFSHGWRFALLVPLVLGFAFMVTAWIYCLRGWLVSLMVNQRKRRAVIMWITFSIVLVSQSPQFINVYFQRRARTEREARRAALAQPARPPVTPEAPPADTEAQVGQQLLETAEQTKAAGPRLVEAVTQAHPWVPLLWMANGARGLAAAQIWPALWGAAGMAALGCWGLFKAYRSTLRFYRAEGPVPPAKAKAVAPANGRRAGNWVGGRLPWVPEDSAALALAQLRSMSRAPEIRMALGMGLFMPLFLPLMMFWGAGARLPEVAKPFVGTGMVVMVAFMLLQLAFNQFGYDRDGFRGLVLLPTPRARLLLGKNLALLPVFALVAVVPLILLIVMAKLSLPVVLATLLQFIAAFGIVSMAGNLTSILLPYRVAVGSLKPTKSTWRMSVGILVVMVLFPVAISPVFLPPALGWALERWGGLPAGFINPIASAGLCGALGILYWILIQPMGRLMQRRETAILSAITESAE
jgi:hypothetical protein